MKFNDAILGAIFIVIAALMIQQSFSFPGFPGQDYGPNLFPRIIAGGIILCSVLLIIRGLRIRAATGQAWLAFDDWTRVPRHLISFFLIIGAMLAYILISDTLGFIITAFVLQLGLFLWFSVRPVTAVVVAVVSTLVVQYFFASLLRVPLPRGLLDSIL
jgi:putative tricarboxylic transport membrane protein